MNNINVNDFTSIQNSPQSDSDCKSQCLDDTNCIAFSLDSTCNRYSKINKIQNGTKNDINIKNISFLKNYSNIDKILKYSREKNKKIKNIATKINECLSKIPTDYDYDINEKNTLNTNYEDFKRSQQYKKDLMTINENNIDPTEVNKEYLRYIFLITLMFIFITIFIYFSVNNTINNSNNFMLYLVLFIVVFSVLFIYFLK